MMSNLLVELPEKCIDCMVQREFAHEMLMNAVMRRASIEEASELLGPEGEKLEVTLTEILGDEEMGKIQAGKLRREAEQEISKLDDTETDILARSALYSSMCKGVAWAKAVQADTEYEIGVCTYPEIYAEAGSDYVTTEAAVRIRPVSEPEI